MYDRLAVSRLLLGFVVLAACSFDSGGVDMNDGSVPGVDASVIDANVLVADADPNAPDADPNAPDATPAPDASVVPPDASVVPPDASVVPPDASVVPPDATVLPPDATVLPPDATVLPPDATVLPPDAMCSCDDGADCTTDICSSLGGSACTHIDTCGSGRTCNVAENRCEGKLTLNQGVNGYTGTQDTFVQQSSPSASNGNRSRIEWDADDPFMSGNEKIGLLRFDGFVGLGADQIPSGATVLSATLSLVVTDGSNGPEGSDLHSVLVDWSESTTTYANFGGDTGVNSDEISASAVATAPPTACDPACPITMSIDVTSSVQAWVTSPATNFGWAIMPGATDGTDVGSSNTGRTDLHPVLDILYAVAP